MVYGHWCDDCIKDHGWQWQYELWKATGREVPTSQVDLMADLTGRLGAWWRTLPEPVLSLDWCKEPPSALRAAQMSSCSPVLTWWQRLGLWNVPSPTPRVRVERVCPSLPCRERRWQWVRVPGEFTEQVLPLAGLSPAVLGRRGDARCPFLAIWCWSGPNAGLWERSWFKNFVKGHSWISFEAAHPSYSLCFRLELWSFPRRVRSKLSVSPCFGQFFVCELAFVCQLGISVPMQSVDMQAVIQMPKYWCLVPLRCPGVFWMASSCCCRGAKVSSRSCVTSASHTRVYSLRL